MKSRRGLFVSKGSIISSKKKKVFWWVHIEIPLCFLQIVSSFLHTTCTRLAMASLSDESVSEGGSSFLAFFLLLLRSQYGTR